VRHRDLDRVGGATICAAKHSHQFSAYGYADTPLTEKRFSDPAARQQLLDRTPMGRLGIANGVLFWRPTNHPGSPTRSWSSIGVPAQ
jgi:hypothetical protein